jgi:dipeptidyl aminopeptidase/acylaminoacyl peptidase
MRMHFMTWSAILMLLAGGAVARGEDTTQPPERGTRLLTIDDYFAIGDVADPVISPDGTWVAFTVETADLEQDEALTRVWMAPLAGGEAIPLTAAGSSASDPRWRPDGSALSFLSDREDEDRDDKEDISQLYLLDLRGGEATRVAGLEQGIEAYEWSPDGKRLVLVLEDPKPDEDEANGTEENDEETPEPWVIDRLQFKRDGEGYLDRRRDHLYVYEPESKRLQQITFGDYEDSDPVWSPDGRFIAFVSNRSEEPDANYNTDLWLVEPDTADPAQSLARVTTNPGSDQDPVWHPDGTRLAYVTITRPDLVDYAQTDVAVTRLGEAAPTILTADLDRMVHEPRFSPDGETVYFTVEDHGEVALAAAPVTGGAIERPISGRLRVDDSAVARHGTVVAVISEPSLPAELFALDPAAGGSPLTRPRRLTHVNRDALAGIRSAGVEKVRFASDDGTEIETFLYTPPGFERGRRYPTILWIHGGPQGQYDWGWDFDAQLFAANGYVVVMPNPRGSTGYGQEFCLAIWADWGNLDGQDVLAAVDHAVELGYSDPDRLGVGGWSYGGILTNYVITSTDRFKAAMSGASGALWVALYGHDHYQHWYEVEFGLPWETRELWERLSPYNRVQDITTPTLWMGGEDDWNVPILTSEIMYQAMRRLGRDTLLVVYPGEDHGIDTPSYVRHMYQQWLAWYGSHLKD